MQASLKIKYLAVFLIATMLWSMIALVPSAKAADEFDGLRAKWKSYLLGGEYNAADPNVILKLESITSKANEYWSSMTPTGGTYLWSDLSDWKRSGTISNNYGRLHAMALAYSSSGSSLQGNALLADDIIKGLDWMYANQYNPSKSEIDNWYDWEIGTPNRLNDIMVMMYDQLSATQINNYISAIDKWCPNASNRVINNALETGANRADKALNLIIRGIIGKSSSKIAQGRDALSQIFLYVNSGNGYYADGSYVDHGYIPYTGSYGLVLLTDMAKLLYILNGSTWAVTDPNVSNVYDWVTNAYQPLIYKGAMMDMVAGRNLSRQGGQDHLSGRSTIGSILFLAQSAPADKAKLYKSMVKEWVLSDTTFTNYYDSISIFLITLFKSAMNDASITPFGELVKSQVFASMDRVAHLRPGFGIGLSMFSNRISAFEFGNGENSKAWWTGVGMTQLYNNDLNQFSDNYWATVNSYRLPGTTTDHSSGSTMVAWKNYSNPNTWVGGSSVDGLYSTAGMQFSLSQNTGSPLQGKKSWFMFGDKMVALGAGITNTNNANVETIVENRKLDSNGDNTLTVNGVTKPSEIGWSETMANVQWAHLAGNAAGSDIGYYFPGGASLNGLRESRTGAWRDINQGGSTTPYTNNFFSLAFNHGVNPTNASYAYVVLPNKSSVDMARYANNPDISILENGEAAQAVKDTSLNAVGANFWNDVTKSVSVGGTSFITSDKKASVTTLETANQINIGVSDPTQINKGTINIEINRSATGVISLDPGITVTQLSPTIMMTVNVNGAFGKTFNAKFNFGASDVKVAPVLITPQTGVSSQVHLSWASVGGEIGYRVKYGTAPGNYTNTIQINTLSSLNNYNVTGLTNGTPYYFAVSAIGSAGESGNSNEVTATPSIASNPSASLNDTADAFVRDGTFSNTNYGNDSTMYIKNDGTSYYRSAYLKFDLSSIIGKVWNARLILVPTGGNPGHTNQANLVDNNAWNESTITWSNKPESGIKLATWTVPAMGTPVTIDVTDQINEALTADKLLSIAVSSPTNQGNVYVTYASKENSNKAYRPVILINSPSIDSIVPATTAVITSEQADGLNSWYSHPVTLALTASDNLSGVAKTEYTLDGGVSWKSYNGPVTFAEDAKYIISYRSTDYAGNIESAKTVSFNLDATAPIITVSGLVYGSYSDTGDINPLITLSDNLSGVDSRMTTVTLDTYAVHQGEVIALYTLPLGTHEFIVTTSDMAGNVNSQIIVFQTTANISSLQSLVQSFTKSNWIDNEGIAKSLLVKLSSNNLNSFVREVQAQKGKHISIEAANYLLRDAEYTISNK